jgi:polyphosphate kinase
MRDYRGEVKSLELLNRLVSAPLPAGLRAGPVETLFNRDVYFDAPDRTLRRRGVTCRFRTRIDDRRLLTLRVEPGPGDVGPPQLYEAEVAELDDVSALAGSSDPARRLRALIDPQLLTSRIEFETERRRRRSRPRWFANAVYELCYDVVTVRAGGLAGTFQELKIRTLRRGWPGLERLATALRADHDVRPLLIGKRERAEKLHEALESEALARAVQDNREVTVMALEQGQIALRHTGGSLRLPVGSGSGEVGCRFVLRTEFGSADGQVRLLGTVPAAPGRPLLEVWLVRRLGSGLAVPAGMQIQWVPLTEVVERIGAPVLHEPRTLAALAVAARSDLVPEWPNGPRPPGESADAGAVSPGVITREWTIAGLREPRPSAVEESALGGRDHFLNSQLSWLEFNGRVLALAEDPTLPLLARVRFLSIFRTNLDEFFMVRVGALKRALQVDDRTLSEDGLTAREQLDAVFIRLRSQLERYADCWLRQCLPALAAQGIRVRSWSDLSEPERAHLRDYFAEQVFPLLTPQAITRAPGYPFPVMANLRLSLAALVRDSETGPVHFAYVKLPDDLPRVVPLPDDGGLVPLEEVVRGCLDLVYRGRLIEAAYTFRVTRSGDLDLDERHAENLLHVIEEEAKRRPYGLAVRIEVEHGMRTDVRRLLLRELQFEDAEHVSTLGHADLFDTAGPLDPLALREIASLPRAPLQYPAFSGRRVLKAAKSVFELVAERDVLVHHPYDSFPDVVERFFVEAADDPDVAAIKLTLYRPGGRSLIADALVRAAAAGKEVFVFVELKARFDEERNVDWAKKLERAGIHVVYGFVDVKTHAKVGLVVRREGGGVRCYVHVGTGNYNAATAAVYTDLGLLTAHPELGADLNDLFNELSGSSRPPQVTFRRLLVAPEQMLERVLALINREAEYASAGQGGRIRAKLNGLADADVIGALYRASQAGVEIDLVVRGICCLRPGVPGLSDRIRVISILGRFLEHGRILAFANGGEPEFYIGSADWRPRNLRRRVEVATPILDPGCRARLDRILEMELADPTAWELGPDGGYYRRAGGDVHASAQERLMRLAQGERA